MYNSLSDLLKNLEIQNAPESWRESWEPAMARYHCDAMDLLTGDGLTEANRLLKLNEEIMQAFLEALAIIRKSPALCQLAWLWNYIIFSGEEDPDYPEISNWPAPVAAMNSYADMLHAVVLVSGIPRLLEFYEKRKLPHDVFLDTLSDVGICMEEYRAKYGMYGVGEFRMGWLLYHFTGKLFRLGRLQFIHRNYEGSYKVFRNYESGQVIALCDPGLKFDGRDLICETNKAGNTQKVWETEYYDASDFFEGNPVTSSGYALREKVKLLKREWEAVLSKGDGVLDTHIAGGGRMEYGLCGASYRMALEFFPKYFSEKKFKGFTCFSWLLNPSLKLLLPGDSNIVKFQSDYYLLPLTGDDSVFEYVFGSKPDDLSALPAHTSLQRSIRNYLLEGKTLSSTGGFMLKEEVGKQLKNYFDNMKG